MTDFTIAIETAIKNHLSTVMAYALSQREAAHFMKRFSGEWPYVVDVVHRIPLERANLALIELAVLFRMRDDQDRLTGDMGDEIFGDLIKPDGTVTHLSMRDISNKIIHSESISWDFSDPEDPKVIAKATVEQARRFKWTEAKITIQMFFLACSVLLKRA